jgi:hypothetical protein
MKDQSGVITLDKSAIQSLSRDEVWMLTKHYLVVLAPVLLFEIVGDLKKDPREGRMPEGEAIWLAGKLLDSESKLNVRYPMACLESMLGNDPQAGHILMGGAKANRSVDGEGRHTFR